MQLPYIKQNPSRRRSEVTHRSYNQNFPPTQVYISNKLPAKQTWASLRPQKAKRKF